MKLRESDFTSLAFTISRIFILPLMVYVLLYSHLEYHRELAASLIAFVVVADVVDGIIARKRGEETIRRRVADAVIDRITVHVFCPMALAVCDVTLLWYIPLLLRDLALLAIILIMMRRKRVIVTPNAIHKIIMLVLAIAGIAVVLEWSASIHVLAFAYGLLFLSLIDYLFVYLSLCRGKNLSVYRPSYFEGIIDLLTPDW